MSTGPNPKKTKIFVNYFIQNDTWETIGEPNCFPLPGEYTNLNDVKAKMVYENFPMRDHFQFYLRFFLDDKSQNVKGWIDFPPNATIPVYGKGIVYVKALRLPKGTKLTFKNDIFAKKSTPIPQREKKFEQPKQTSQNLMFMEEETNQHTEQPPQKKKEVSNKEQSRPKEKEAKTEKGYSIPMDLNLDKIADSLKDTTKNQQEGMKKKNNVNVNNTMSSKTPIPEKKQPQSFNNFNSDLHGIFSDLDNKTQKGSQSPREKGKTKIDETLQGVFSDIPNTQSKVQQNDILFHDLTGTGNVNMNMNMNVNINSNNPIDNISPNLSEDDIKDQVNKILNKWVEGVNEKKNLLYLLTTLHEVWTTESQLGNISMQDLVNNKASVRTYYKRAMKELHPDKNKLKDFKTQYIASCLYQILNEANSTYI